MIAVRPLGERQLAVQPSTYLGPGVFEVYRKACDAAGARYDGRLRCNVVERVALPNLVAHLRRVQLEVALAPELHAELAGVQDRAAAAVVDAQQQAAQADADARARGLALYPYQAAGVAWLRSRKAGLLADAMGLGKTIQALAALPSDGSAGVVVIAPAAVKGVWAREAARWRPDYSVRVLSGRGSFRWPRAGQIIVSNYDILPDALGSPDVQVYVICDEAHLAKSAKATRTKRVRLISECVLADGGTFWLLTGTPLLNRPPELWDVLEAAHLGKEAWGTKAAFCRAFNATLVKIPGKGRGMTYQWGAPDKSVAEMLQRVSLRRRREEVLPDLPTKTHETRVVDEYSPELREQLDRFVADLAAAGVTIDSLVQRAQLSRDQREVIFEQLSAIRAALATAKIPAMLDVVAEHEEAEEPLVVFSAHRAPIDILATRSGWATITGDTPHDDRTRIVEQFQSGNLRGVALTIQAGGAGLTLTKSARMVFVDLMWTPALNAQAEDRCCRIGQTRGIVVTRLVTDHPVDLRVAELLDEKQRLIEQTVEASAVTGAALETAAAATVSVLVDQAAQVAAVLDEVKIAEPVDEPKTLTVHVNGKAVEIPDTSERNGKRPPQSPEEIHAAGAMVLLATLDPDHAATENGAGFSKSDGEFGHSLADQVKRYGRLSDNQWACAVRLARRYHRQVGEPQQVAS